MKKRISREELMARLFWRDPRVVYYQIKKGRLPHPLKTDSGCFFDRDDILKRLGIKSFKEKFIKIKKAQKVLGLSRCKIEHGINLGLIPCYRLADTTGNRFLFLKSELLAVKKEYWHGLRADWNPQFQNWIGSMFMYKDTLQSLLKTKFIKDAIRNREYDIFKSYADGKILTEINKGYKLTPFRITQIITEVRLKIFMAIEKTDELYHNNEKLRQENAMLKTDLTLLKAGLQAEAESELKPEKEKPIYSKTLISCGFSAKPINLFAWAQLKTVADLCAYGINNFYKPNRMKYIGKKTITEIEDFLKKNKLKYNP